MKTTLPGRKAKSIIDRDAQLMSPSFTRSLPFVFNKGKGCWVLDADGHRFLDFAAGIAVMSVGYGNLAVMKAVRQQLQRGTHAAFSDFYAEAPVALCETLRKLLPSRLDTFFLSNSGTEAVEAALKCAKWHTGKQWVIAFRNAFHGRTMGSLSMTNSKPVQRERFGPFLPVSHASYPYVYRSNHETPEACVNACLDEVERLIKHHQEDVAAVFVEPIQGEGGYIVPPEHFLPHLKKLCGEYGVLLVMDEVQSGCFRTGLFLAEEHSNTYGDIVCMAKGVGAGFPLGVTVANRKIMNWVAGSHANTYGGNLISCAAGNAALNFMIKQKIGKRVQAVGAAMMERLRDVAHRSPIVGAVRGKGLMIGVEIVRDKASKLADARRRDAIVLAAFQRGLLLLDAGISVIRICPPLVLSGRDAHRGLDILEAALRQPT